MRRKLTPTNRFVNITLCIIGIVVLLVLSFKGISVYAAQADSPMVIFVKDNVGSGDGSGVSYENAFAPNSSVVTPGQYNVNNQQNTSLYQAWEAIFQSGVTEATIVICGEYVISDSECYTQSGWTSADFNYKGALQPNVNITYTSVYGGVDYRQAPYNASISLTEHSHLAFPSATTTENIVFESVDRSASSTVSFLSASCCDLYLGNDTKFEQPTGFCILGGTRSNGPSTRGSTSVTVDIGNDNEIGKIHGLSNGGQMHTGTSNIHIKSGTVIGNIVGDGVMADAVGINGNVQMRFSGGIIKSYVYGVNVGFHNTNGKVEIVVTGGDFWDCKGIHPTDGALSASKNIPASSKVNLSGLSAADAALVENRIARNFYVVMPAGSEDAYYVGGLRQAVVDYMYAMANVQWTSNAYIDYTTTPGAGANLKYEVGKTYLGMVYNNNRAGLEKFQSILVNGSIYNETDTGWQTSPGNSCATSIEHAWQIVSPSVEYEYSQDMNPILAQGVLPVGDVAWGVYDATTKLTDPVVTATGETGMYEAYAKIYKGDAVVRYKNGGGHAMMVTSDVHVIRKADGSIDPSKSYVLLTDQNNTINNARAYPSSWGYNVKTTFAKLYADGYIPVTCKELVENKCPIPAFRVVNASTSRDMSSCHLRGILESNYNIMTVTANILDAQGQIVKTAEDYPYTKTYDLANLSGVLSLGGLASGEYRLQITAKAGLGADKALNTPQIVHEVELTKETDLVIFIKDEVGAGTGDGLSYENALTPQQVVPYGQYGVHNQKNTALYQAWKMILDANVDSATIVICDEYTISDAMCYTQSGWSNADFTYQDGLDGNVTITYTSVYGGVDYREKNGACIRLTGKAQLAFPAATVTNNLTFESVDRTTGTTILAGNHFGLHLGQGTRFAQPQAFSVVGGKRSSSGSTGVSNIIIDIGDENQIGNIYGLSYGGNGHVGNVNITVESGSIVGNIAGDGVIENQVGITGNVSITVNGGIIRGNIYGVTGGFATTEGTVSITVNGGDFENCGSVRPTDGSLASGKYAPASAVLDLGRASASVADVVADLSSGFSSTTMPLVIFVKDNIGSGTGDGSSFENAFAPNPNVVAASQYNTHNQKNTALYQAWQQCIANGGGTIVICGNYVISDSECYTQSGWSNADFNYQSALRPDITITYTSVYDGVDYRATNNAAIVLTEHAHIAFPTATKTENITFASQSRAANCQSALMAASCCDLYLGNGTNFANPSNLRVIGGTRSNSSTTSVSTSITVDIGNGNQIGEVYGLSGASNDHTGSATIRILSGRVTGNIVGDGTTVGLTGVVDISISGGEIQGTVYGVVNGFKDASGEVYITITGGDFTGCDGIHATDGSLKSDAYFAPASAVVDLYGLTETARDQIQPKIGSDFTVDQPLVIFITDNFGAGSGNGLRVENALRPQIICTPGVGQNSQQNTALYQAWEMIFKSGRKNATIVICGEYRITDQDCYYFSDSWSNADFKYLDALRTDVTITYTSVYAGVDYRVENGAKIILEDRSQFAFPSATITENLTFTGANRTNSGAIFISGSCCDLYLGNDTKFESPSNFTILGGVRSNNSDTAGSTNITVDIGNSNQIGNIYGLSVGNVMHTGTSAITIKSGTVIGKIVGDGVSANAVGIHGEVLITIEGGIIRGSIYGVTEGFYGQNQGVLNVVITGGDFTNCATIAVADAALSTGDSSLYGTYLPGTATVTIDYTAISEAMAAIIQARLDSRFSVVSATA